MADAFATLVEQKLAPIPKTVITRSRDESEWPLGFTDPLGHGGWSNDHVCRAL